MMIFLTFLTSLVFLHPVLSMTAPDCPNIYFPNTGILDTWSTFSQCYQSSIVTQAPLIAPCAFSGTPVCAVASQFVFNNLVSVDELHQTVIIDFKFRLSWTDNRWNIPQLFNQTLSKMKTSYTSNGIEIQALVKSGDWKIWLPDITFSDAQSETLLSESIRIRPNGAIYWSRHFVLALSQSGFLSMHYFISSLT